MTLDAEQDKSRASSDERDHAQSTLLLHIAISNPADADELSRRLARPKRDVLDDVKALLRDGRAHVYSGALRTALGPAMIASTPTDQIRERHEQVLAEVRSHPSPRPGVLVALVESGCSDRRILPLLVRSLAQHESDSALLGAVMHLARSRHLSEDDVTLLRARRIRYWASPTS